MVTTTVILGAAGVADVVVVEELAFDPPSTYTRQKATPVAITTRTTRITASRQRRARLVA